MRYATLRLILVLVISGPLVACDLNIFGPDIHGVNVRPMDPVPAVYEEWYRATETCLGMTGDFGSVDWFVADEIWADGERVVGWLHDGHKAVIEVRFVEVEWVVRHEMVHHITGWGNGAHDADGNLPCEV